MTVEVVEGPQALEALGERLDELYRVTGVPVTARRTWLQTWFDCLPRHRQAVVAVHGDEGLDAAAVLAVARTGRSLDVVAAGHGLTDMSALPARDPASAHALARGIVDWLDDLGSRWRLTLRLVRAEDEATGRTLRLMRHATLREGDVSPVLRADSGQALRAYVSQSHMRQYRKHLNRMRREELRPSISHLTDPRAIADVMGEVETVMRARDRSTGRPCILDDPVGGRFFRLVVDRHAVQGGVCLTTLRLADELAAYALCFVDGNAYRFWNGRFDPRWARLGAGAVVTDEAVTHALEQGCTEFDLMRGEEPYKAGYANARLRTLDLFGWSGGLGAARGHAFLAARAAARRAETSGGPPARAVAALRGLTTRTRGTPR